MRALGQEEKSDSVLREQHGCLQECPEEAVVWRRRARAPCWRGLWSYPPGKRWAQIQALGGQLWLRSGEGVRGKRPEAQRPGSRGDQWETPQAMQGLSEAEREVWKWRAGSSREGSAMAVGSAKEAEMRVLEAGQGSIWPFPCLVPRSLSCAGFNCVEPETVQDSPAPPTMSWTRLLEPQGQQRLSSSLKTKSADFRARSTHVQMPALSLTSRVTKASCLNFSEPESPHLKPGDDNSNTLLDR